MSSGATSEREEKRSSRFPERNSARTPTVRNSWYRDIPGLM